MTTDQLLSQPPAKLAESLNEALEQEQMTLEQWLEQQAVDRESLLQYMEHSGFSYLPLRNRFE